MKTISQREARRLQQRVAKLENQLDMQRANWSNDWPGGINIDTMTVKEAEFSIADTARKLGHAVVVIPRANGSNYEFLIYALALPSDGK